VTGNQVVVVDADGSDRNPPNWPLDDYLVSVQWAPRGDRFLVLGRTGGLLCRPAGIVETLSWPAEPLANPRAGWLSDGESFFVRSRQPDADLRFYAAADGPLLARNLSMPPRWCRRPKQTSASCRLLLRS